MKFSAIRYEAALCLGDRGRFEAADLRCNRLGERLVEASRNEY